LQFVILRWAEQVLRLSLAQTPIVATVVGFGLLVSASMLFIMWCQNRSLGQASLKLQAQN